MKKLLVFGILTASILANQAMAYGKTPAEPSLVTVVSGDKGEKFLADSINKTLYTFDLDAGKASPVCAGDCAEVWPPYIVTDEESAALRAPLAVIKRKNEKLQLTYEGKAVYTYIFDRVSGDIKGDGLGGVWHLIELK